MKQDLSIQQIEGIIELWLIFTKERYDQDRIDEFIEWLSTRTFENLRNQLKRVQ